MREERPAAAEVAQVAAGTDSHGSAKKPSGKHAFPAVAAEEQKALDVVRALPLHLKVVLTYEEVAAVGIAPVRSLRRLVATGRVKRAVLRIGRSVRFVKDDLLAELRESEE